MCIVSCFDILIDELASRSDGLTPAIWDGIGLSWESRQRASWHQSGSQAIVGRTGRFNDAQLFGQSGTLRTRQLLGLDGSCSMISQLQKNSGGDAARMRGFLAGIRAKRLHDLRGRAEAGVRRHRRHPEGHVAGHHRRRGGPPLFGALYGARVDAGISQRRDLDVGRHRDDNDQSSLSGRAFSTTGTRHLATRSHSTSSGGESVSLSPEFAWPLFLPAPAPNASIHALSSSSSPTPGRLDTDWCCTPAATNRRPTAQREEPSFS